MLTLADLKPDERAVIDTVDPARPSVQRLMLMGLVEGTEVEFVTASLGGDPLEIRVYGSTLSLRRDDALRFTVQRVQALA